MEENTLREIEGCFRDSIETLLSFVFFYASFSKGRSFFNYPRKRRVMLPVLSQKSLPGPYNFIGLLHVAGLMVDLAAGKQFTMWPQERLVQRAELLEAISDAHDVLARDASLDGEAGRWFSFVVHVYGFWRHRFGDLRMLDEEGRKEFTALKGQFNEIARALRYLASGVGIVVTPDEAAAWSSALTHVHGYGMSLSEAEARAHEEDD